MDLWNLIPAVRRARQERDRAQLFADECRDALRHANERLMPLQQEVERRRRMADECGPAPDDCYVAIFGSQQQRGLVTWVGAGGTGTTSNLSLAGAFPRKTAAKIAGNSRSKVLVPVWFIAHLQVRRVVDSRDELNRCVWHPMLLEKAIRSARAVVGVA